MHQDSLTLPCVTFTSSKYDKCRINTLNDEIAKWVISKLTKCCLL